MSPSSDRGAVEPVTALVAVFAVSMGLALYAGVLDETLATTTSERNLAPSAADAVESNLSTAGIVDPSRLDSAAATIPPGYERNVTLYVSDDHSSIRRWTSGPAPSANADLAVRTVSVSIGPGDVRRGRLVVRVWR